MKSKNLYSVSFDIVNRDNDNEFVGFELNIPNSDGFGQPGFGMATLYHDIFEHWFENTKYFQTDELSSQGEACAMGVRQWISENSHALENFGMYNKYQGMQWNSNAVVEGFLYDEINEEYTEYPVGEMFKGRPCIDKASHEYNSLFIDDKYSEENRQIVYRLEKASGYGYLMAEYVFSQLDCVSMINSFCENLKSMMDQLEIDETGEYWTIQENPFLDRGLMSVSVDTDSIKAVIRLNNGKELNVTDEGFDYFNLEEEMYKDIEEYA